MIVVKPADAQLLGSFASDLHLPILALNIHLRQENNQMSSSVQYHRSIASPDDTSHIYSTETSFRKASFGGLQWQSRPGSRSQQQGHPASSTVGAASNSHLARIAPQLWPSTNRTSMASSHTSRVSKALQQCTSLLPRLQYLRWLNTLCNFRE